MILADTSAWVEFLRGTGSPTNLRVRAELPADLAITEAVRMEVLSGARDEARAVSLARLLLRATTLAVGPADFDSAAAIYRACRQNAFTPRSIVDCLIAAVAIRSGVPVLHNDTDFVVLAKFSPLVEMSS